MNNTLLTLSRNSEGINDLISDLGVENISIIYDLGGSSDFFTCTCGYRASKGKGYSKIFYDKNNKDYGMDSRGLEIVKCPQCGNAYVIDYVNGDEDNVALKMNHKVIRNDDHMLWISLKFIGLSVYESVVDYYEDDTDFIIFYDRKKKVFGIGRFEEDVFGTDSSPIIPEKDYRYDFRNNLIISEDGETIGEILDNNKIDRYSGFHYLMDATFTDEIYEKYGVEKLVNTIQNSIGIETTVLLDNADCLHRLFVNLFIEINIKWYYDLFYKCINSSFEFSLSGSLETLENIYSLYQYLEEIGINNSAETAEEAFGLTWDEIKECNNIHFYKTYKFFKEKLREENIEEYVRQHLKIYHNSEIEHLIKLSERTGQSMETIIKFFVRSPEKNETNLVEMIYMVNRIIDSDMMHIINFNQSYSVALIKKFQILKSGLVSEGALSEILKNPTMNTVLKVLSE